MQKSFIHRLLVTLALTGIFFQMLSPLVPAYMVHAEDTVVLEESNSSSTVEEKNESVNSSSESSLTSSESSSSSSETIQESSSSSTETIVITSSSESSVSSSSSSSEESVVESSSSSSESTNSILSSSSSSSSSSIVTVLSETSSSASSIEVAPVVSSDVVITSIVPELNEVVDVTLVESNKSNNILEDLFPFLFTDKSDYSPTESAVISGKGFSPNVIYSVTVSSSDNPETTTTHNVIASSEGTFTYVYQLDGTYRPNYKVEVKDMSGEVVATTSFTDSDTTYKAPSSNSGSWSNASNAYANGGGSARGTDNDRHTYSNFGFSIPAGNIITGIEVQADTWSSNNDFCQLDVDLSWNGGSNWTNQKSTGNLNDSESTKTLGTASDNWGRTWATTDFTNSNFRLRVQHGDSGSACSDDDSTYLDFIRAKVTYISNVAPVITEGTSVNVDMSVNAIPTAFALTLNATDADVPTQTLTWNISSNGSHGSASVSGSGNSKSITYTPDDNYIGTDSFTVRVSDPYGLTDTIVVNVNVSTVTNPLLTSVCGNDIALVIDTSLSTNTSELNQSKTALIGIVNALSTTPNRFSVVKFGTSATVVQGFTSNTTDVINAINSVSLSYGLTNLSTGISTARGTFDPRADKPNLMIVASDGNPTWPLFSGLTSAINQSSLTKTYPIRMVMLGIGSSVNVNNLKAISGPNVGSNSSSDVVTTNFSDLATSLANSVSQSCGSITVIKDSNPNDAEDFQFTASEGLTPSSFFLDDDPSDQTLSNTQVFTNVPAGTYSVNENKVKGWSLTVSCSNGNPSTNIVLAPGENVTCTFTNTKNVTLIVQKTTYPSNDETLFPITLVVEDDVITPDEAVNDVISDSLDKTYNLIAGKYSVEETVPEGWVQTGNDCMNVVLAPGDVKTCVITNTKLSNLKIVKDASINSLDNFVFNSTLGTFTLDDDDGVVGSDDTFFNNKLFKMILPGEYSFSEVNPSTLWALNSITCIEGENTPYTIFTTNQTGMVLTIPAGKNITCTFNNVLGSVLGVTDPGTVLAVTGDNSIYAQLLGLIVMLGSFGVLVISKTRRKYSK